MHGKYLSFWSGHRKLVYSKSYKVTSPNSPNRDFLPYMMLVLIHKKWFVWLLCFHCLIIKKKCMVAQRSLYKVSSKSHYKHWCLWPGRFSLGGLCYNGVRKHLTDDTWIFTLWSSFVPSPQTAFDIFFFHPKSKVVLLTIKFDWFGPNMIW